MTALLFDREGQEVYLRPPASFNIPLNQPISFAEIQELARIKRQTALGYITTDNHQSEAAGASSDRKGGAGGLIPWVIHSVIQKLSRAATVHLGLSAADQVLLKDGDWLVVLAEDFE